MAKAFQLDAFQANAFQVAEVYNETGHEQVILGEVGGIDGWLYDETGHEQTALAVIDMKEGQLLLSRRTLDSLRVPNASRVLDSDREVRRE